MIVAAGPECNTSGGAPATAATVAAGVCVRERKSGGTIANTALQLQVYIPVYIILGCATAVTPSIKLYSEEEWRKRVHELLRQEPGPLPLSISVGEDASAVEYVLLGRKSVRLRFAVEAILAKKLDGIGRPLPRS